jgi:hypothetical protein
MDHKISTQTKEKLVWIPEIQYRESSKMGNAQILDQFIVVNGYRKCLDTEQVGPMNLTKSCSSRV